MVDPRTPAEMLFAAASEMKDTMISSSIRRRERVVVEVRGKWGATFQLSKP